MLSRIFAIFSLVVASCSAHATSVVFLNPGYDAEPFWSGYVRVMHEAAGDLGLAFEVLNGQRDADVMRANLRKIQARKNKPDYLLFTNELGLGPEVVRQLAGSGITLMALHSTITPEQQQLLGRPRLEQVHWIGSLIPNDEEAGYLMGRALLKHYRPGDELLAFSAPKTTPSSVYREEGLMRALAERPEVRLRQVVNGEWNQQRAYEQAQVLLPRYPAVRLVWAANDEMAFGALQAATALGRDIKVTALNNAKRTFDAAIDGRISVLVSGHFMLGACALVLLYDHAHGHDFSTDGAVQKAALLRLVDRQQAAHLSQKLQSAALGLNFRRFSALDKGESCSIDALLD